MRRVSSLAVLTLTLASCAQERDPSQLGQSEIPLPDQPIGGTSTTERRKIEQAIEPYVKIARSTYPDAKARYQSGLPDGSMFFVTVQIHDDAGGMEQAFVQVTSIDSGQVAGIIASEMTAIRGFRLGQSHTFSETEILDWTISNPDGTQEGNIVGRFLAEWQASRN